MSETVEFNLPYFRLKFLLNEGALIGRRVLN